jgi:hypothetical protein
MRTCRWRGVPVVSGPWLVSKQEPAAGERLDRAAEANGWSDAGKGCWGDWAGRSALGEEEEEDEPGGIFPSRGGGEEKHSTAP